MLTPHDTWHNHGNEGEGGAVNLSVLDMPLVNVLNATYFESDYFEEDEHGRRIRKETQENRFHPEYSRRTYGQGGLLPRSVSHERGTGNASPMYVYRWEATRELLENLRDLDGAPWDGVMVEYVDPTTGRAPYATMTFFAQMLRPGEKTLPSRQNASLIYTVFEGHGHSVVGGQRFDWEPFDTFCVPGGEWVEHVNGSGRDDAIFSSPPTSRRSRRSTSTAATAARSPAEEVLLETSRTVLRRAGSARKNRRTGSGRRDLEQCIVT